MLLSDFASRQTKLIAVLEGASAQIKEQKASLDAYFQGQVDLRRVMKSLYDAKAVVVMSLAENDKIIESLNEMIGQENNILSDGSMQARFLAADSRVLKEGLLASNDIADCAILDLKALLIAHEPRLLDEALELDKDVARYLPKRSGSEEPSVHRELATNVLDTSSTMRSRTTSPHPCDDSYLHLHVASPNARSYLSRGSPSLQAQGQALVHSPRASNVVEHTTSALATSTSSTYEERGNKRPKSALTLRQTVHTRAASSRRPLSAIAERTPSTGKRGSVSKHDRKHASGGSNKSALSINRVGSSREGGYRRKDLGISAWQKELSYHEGDDQQLRAARPERSDALHNEVRADQPVELVFSTRHPPTRRLGWRGPEDIHTQIRDALQTDLSLHGKDPIPHRTNSALSSQRLGTSAIRPGKRDQMTEPYSGLNYRLAKRRKSGAGTRRGRSWSATGNTPQYHRDGLPRGTNLDAIQRTVADLKQQVSSAKQDIRKLRSRLMHQEQGMTSFGHAIAGVTSDLIRDNRRVASLVKENGLANKRSANLLSAKIAAVQAEARSRSRSPSTRNLVTALEGYRVNPGRDVSRHEDRPVVYFNHALNTEGTLLRRDPSVPIPALTCPVCRVDRCSCNMNQALLDAQAPFDPPTTTATGNSSTLTPPLPGDLFDRAYRRRIVSTVIRDITKRGTMSQ
ncbi:hypothetical protein GMRT_10267 [Giardia muris]|uniref:Uncharacterized protein n=1 Tax=Giardia muris TaxID=5742 RepID=A0A4Z1TA96_GIAMU|nr:hypothetical protein GMRT_10267 [Giardia muris]|eukprot:TNJ29441.1 hypothetical protein GMRT_10267 [Giardia muris]